MSRAAIRHSELCAIELLAKQELASIYELSGLSVPRMHLPVDVTFASFTAFAEQTETKLPTPMPEGLTVRHGGRYFVLYNDRQGSERRRAFTLAHELGHIMLGHAGEEEAREEREANAFAASLLAPAIVFYYLSFRDGHAPSAEEMTVLFALSREAAENRRRDLLRRRPPQPTDSEIALLLQLFGKIAPIKK
jgi:hypothetical protein